MVPHSDLIGEASNSVWTGLKLLRRHLISALVLLDVSQPHMGTRTRQAASTRLGQTQSGLLAATPGNVHRVSHKKNMHMSFSRTLTSCIRLDAVYNVQNKACFCSSGATPTMYYSPTLNQCVCYGSNVLDLATGICRKCGTGTFSSVGLNIKFKLT